MALERINKLVVSYCEIPEGLIDEGHWINHHGQDAKKKEIEKLKNDPDYKTYTYLKEKFKTCL